MNHFFKHFFIFITSHVLLGCNEIYDTKNYINSFFHEEVVFIYTSSSYPDEIYDQPDSSLRQATLIFGPYMPNLGRGAGSFGGDDHPYEGTMEDEEVIALWQVPTKNKVLRYYVRSEPNKGIIRAPREGSSAYKVGVALGPMRVFKEGLTEEQFSTAEVAGHTAYGNPLYYRWGEWDKLYYVTGIFSGSDLQEIPRTFYEIQGISITAEQYDKLYKRCHSDWKAVKCFLDENFPDLTPKLNPENDAISNVGVTPPGAVGVASKKSSS